MNPSPTPSDAELAKAMLAVDDPLLWGRLGEGQADMLRKFARALQASSSDREAALQARIDELMLEYCPDEMTPDQLQEYERHQIAVDQPSGLAAALLAQSSHIQPLYYVRHPDGSYSAADPQPAAPPVGPTSEPVAWLNPNDPDVPFVRASWKAANPPAFKGYTIALAAAPQPKDQK